MMVLGSLVVGMTLTAGLLRILEPGAVPPIGGVTLLSIERTAQDRPEDKLFDIGSTSAQETAPIALHDWRAIVIHDSRTTMGNYDAIDRAHRKAGKDGCGYHLVVNNGTGADDGRIEIGYRWRYQAPGDYLIGPNAAWYHQNAIGICVIGDAEHDRFTASQLRELTWVIRQLQQRFEIPPDHVFVDVGLNPNAAAPFFDEQLFRSGLLGGYATALR